MNGRFEIIFPREGRVMGIDWSPVLNRILTIDFGQTFTNIAVAWIAGRFGVSQGLKRVQGEKAFDRRLDWYEETFTAFNNFMLKLNALVPPPLVPEDLRQVHTEFVEAVQKARQCVDKAPVYAEKKTLTEMKKLFIGLGQIRRAPQGKPVETQYLVSKRDAIAAIASEIACELAMSIRYQLGLDEISKEDFRWGKSS
jgi:hypothetical protein